jgi:hypothetical protein
MDSSTCFVYGVSGESALSLLGMFVVNRKNDVLFSVYIVLLFYLNLPDPVKAF